MNGILSEWDQELGEACHRATFHSGMGASARKGGCGDEHLRSQDGHGKVGDGSKVKGNGAVDSHRLIKESIIGCMDLWASCDIFF